MLFLSRSILDSQMVIVIIRIMGNDATAVLTNKAKEWQSMIDIASFVSSSAVCVSRTIAAKYST